MATCAYEYLFEICYFGLPFRVLPEEVGVALDVVDPCVVDADQGVVHSEVKTQQKKETARHDALENHGTKPIM